MVRAPQLFFVVFVFGLGHLGHSALVFLLHIPHRLSDHDLDGITLLVH